ncbi:hypothetical protein F5Y17DRAFT_452417 [Xylariaceae sp. FL0594]|nr:hypothetical protein F5Y17DRAFT_452417 [Xylariaceae sp. FL0594]
MAPAFEDEGSGRPLSVKEISDRAQSFDWNTNIPFKHWLRTAQTLQQEADMYLQDGNFPQAYLLYLRYSSLVLDKLKTHPEAKTADGQKAIRNKVMTVDVVLRHLERLKPIIEREYLQWADTQARSRSRSQQQRPRSAGKPERSAYTQHASKDPALSFAGRLLDASEHQDLAVELAQKEMRRRDASRRETRKKMDGPHGQQSRRTAGFWDNWTKEIAEKQAEDEEVFRRQMESARRDTAPSHTTDHPPRPPSQPQYVTVNYAYPKIAKSAPVDYQPPPSRASDVQTPRPAPPPKQVAEERSLLGPERPNKTPHANGSSTRVYPGAENPTEAPALPPKTREPPVETTTKQQSFAFKPAAYLENGEPIRPIFLPKRLRHQFLELAAENTRRGLEMCGILCGTAVNNALFVRCLLIPEQKCTSDTCETENEGSMLEYCIEADLLMLGWIHTHPTQTCFMSSRDLHTQAGYQVMFPESIAIVCAPKFQPSYGIFRLTNPPGLTHILGCTQSATFHAHSIDNLYTAAGHPPGHVYEHDGLDFYVHDIRPGARNNTGPNKTF